MKFEHTELGVELEELNSAKDIMRYIFYNQ
jgi:hypothetical protein